LEPETEADCEALGTPDADALRQDVEESELSTEPVGDAVGRNEAVAADVTVGDALARAVAVREAHAEGDSELNPLTLGEPEKEVVTEPLVDAEDDADEKGDPVDA